MKMLAASVLLTAVLALTAVAQTTAFSYQGSLQNGGTPANGNFDFQFALFDSPAAGTQLGATLNRTNVAVANGVFSVSLDFGAQFPGADRYVEIRVRTAGGAAYTTLNPRHQIASSPYSVKSFSADVAANATNLNNQPASFYQNAANLNAGTLADARLSSNVPLKNANQIFSGVNQFSNPGNLYTGNGSALSNLDAANLAFNTVPSARFGGTYSNAVSFTNAGNAFTGVGAQLTLLNASNIGSGTLNDARLSPNIPRLNTTNSFTGGLQIDNTDQNNGTMGVNALRFGGGASGEGIAARRTAGANQWGLDIFTNSLPRMSVANNGNVGIGTQIPTAKLEVVGEVKATTVTAANMPAFSYRECSNRVVKRIDEPINVTLCDSTIVVPAAGTLYIEGRADVSFADYYPAPGSPCDGGPGSSDFQFKLDEVLPGGSSVNLATFYYLYGGGHSFHRVSAVQTVASGGQKKYKIDWFTAGCGPGAGTWGDRNWKILIWYFPTLMNAP